MFKNVIVYRIGPGWSATLDQVEEALAGAAFAPLGATQESAIGWVPPRGKEHGALAESVGGQWIVQLMVEQKAVPGSVINRKVAERTTQIEASEGRKPGRKEVKELKEEAKLALLPQAFSRQSSVPVWIDTAARLLLVGAGSQARADEVTSALVEVLPGLTLQLLQTKQSPAAAMAEWLTTQEPPSGLAIDRECELKATDDSKAVVRYAKHPLDIEEIRQHIAQGKMPTRLALQWDDRVAFLLTEGMQLKKISFLEGVFEGGSKDEEGFDADVAIATGELGRLLPDLVEALGGELDGPAGPSDEPRGAAAPAAAPAAPSAAPATAGDVNEDF